MIQNSRNSQDYRNFPTIPTNSRDSPESQNSPEIPILQNMFAKYNFNNFCPHSSFLHFVWHASRQKKKKKKSKNRSKKGNSLKRADGLRQIMRYFRPRTLIALPFPRGSPLYEVITRRGIMGWFSKVKGTLEGIFSLIMRTGQKAAKETSHRLCLHGQLFKVTVPANCIRPRQTILLLYE